MNLMEWCTLTESEMKLRSTMTRLCVEPISSSATYGSPKTSDLPETQQARFGSFRLSALLSVAIFSHMTQIAANPFERLNHLHRMPCWRHDWHLMSLLEPCAVVGRNNLHEAVQSRRHLAAPGSIWEQHGRIDIDHGKAKKHGLQFIRIR